MMGHRDNEHNPDGRDAKSTLRNCPLCGATGVYLSHHLGDCRER